MDSVDRIADLFHRLVSLGPDRIPCRTQAEEVVFMVVAVRCEKDMEGFESIFEQAFEPGELKVLVEGLRSLGEIKLADDFSMTIDLLERDGFYRHLNWELLSSATREQLAEIEERIGSQLWDLDEKLVALVEERT